MVDLGVGVQAEAGDAVEQRLVLVDGAADVERTLDAVERAGLQRDLAEGMFSRTLAHHVEDAARRSRAIEHGRRAGDDLGTIEKPGIDSRNAERGGLQAQPVEILLDIEAARLQRLEAEIAV